MFENRRKKVYQYWTDSTGIVRWAGIWNRGYLATGGHFPGLVQVHCSMGDNKS